MHPGHDVAAMTTLQIFPGQRLLMGQKGAAQVFRTLHMYFISYGSTSIRALTPEAINNWAERSARDRDNDRSKNVRDALLWLVAAGAPLFKEMYAVHHVAESADAWPDFCLRTFKLAQKSRTMKGKGKSEKAEGDEDVTMADGDLASPTEKKKRNKQRVLLLSSRGVTHRMRHLMNDLEALLPHVKKGESLCNRDFIDLHTFCRLKA